MDRSSLHLSRPSESEAESREDWNSPLCGKDEGDVFETCDCFSFVASDEHGAPCSDMWLPRILSMLILDFNFHRIHHRNPAVPWPKLPGLFAADADRYDRGLLTAAVDQLRGPIPLSKLMDRY